MREAPIFLAVLLLGCFSNVKDCGTNITCFQEAAGNNCVPARVTYTSLGLVEYLETKGLSEGKCEVYMRIENVPSALEEILSNAEGKDMVCLVPMAVVHNGLGDIYELGDFCQGELAVILSPLS